MTAHVEPLRRGSGRRWTAQRVTLQPDDGSPPIQLEWYAPRPPHSSTPGATPPRSAAVLIFPILWGNDLGVGDFARAFAREGIHGIIVYRPKDTFSMDRPLSQLEDHLHASVIQVRRAIDWLEIQPSVDPARLGSLGISMGATLNVVVAGVEPRLTRAVFCLPASHLAQVIMTTRDRSIAKKRDEYLRRYDLSPREAEVTLERTLISEPLRVAHAIDPRRSLVIIAIADRVIGWRNSLAIWRALGKPPTVWLPTGHYTSLLVLPYVELKTLAWFWDWQTRRPARTTTTDRSDRTAAAPPDWRLGP